LHGENPFGIEKRKKTTAKPEHREKPESTGRAKKLRKVCCRGRQTVSLYTEYSKR
jgi:hypothetical protein